MRNKVQLLLRDTWAGPSIIGSLPLSLCILILGIVTKLVGNNVIEIIIAHLFIMVIVTLSFQIFTGNSGVISYGHIGFMAIGAYASAILTIPPQIKQAYLPDLPAFIAQNQASFMLAFLVAIILAGILALLIGIAIVRMSSLAAGGPIVTFAFLIVVNVIISGWQGVTAGRRALYGIPTSATIIWISVIAGLGLILARIFRDSPIGLQLRASREDEIAAKVMGINLKYVRLISWVVSSIYAASAGVLLGHYFGVFSPSQFYLATTVNGLAMMLVGGLTTTSGSVLGALVITLIFEATRYLETLTTTLAWLPDLFGLSQIIVGITFLFMLYARAGGIMGRWELDEHIKSWISRK